MSRATELAALGVALCVANGGCGDLLGIEALPEPARGPTAFSYVEEPCAVCVFGACLAEEAACAADPACALWGGCLAGCGVDNFACRADCDAAHAEASADTPALDLDACRRGACGGACYGEGGLFDEIAGPICGECLDLACAGQALTCVQDAGTDGLPGCERQWACATGDPEVNPQRLLDCRAGYPHPDGPERHLDLCRWENCPRQCNFGREWGCLGRYSWPRPEAGTVSLEVFVKPAASTPDAFATLDEVSVKACRPDDCAQCADPLAVAEADAKEVPAVLALPLGGAGFEGCLHLEQAKHNPTIHWFGRPITRSEGRLTVGVLPELDDMDEQIGFELDPDRGTVFVEAWDCLHDPAYGLTFEVSGADDQSVSAYMQGTWYWPELVGLHTLRDGRGGLFNVPVGEHEVVARRLDGEVVARAEVVVRAGWVSQVWLYPTPAVAP